MAIKTFSDGNSLPASDINTYLANSGLVYVAQVSVGSTPVSSVDVTSCFSATYDNYLLTFSNLTSGASAATLNLYLLSGSTPTASGFTGNTFYIVNGASGGMTNSNLTNAAYAEGVGCFDNSSVNAGTIQVLQPFLAAYTQVLSDNIDDNYWRQARYLHKANTSYNGVRLSTGGNMSNGIVTVYGYRKA